MRRKTNNTSILLSKVVESSSFLVTQFTFDIKETDVKNVG